MAAMRPTRMTIEQHGDLYRVVFENTTHQVEIQASRDQLTGWVRQLAGRLGRDEAQVGDRHQIHERPEGGGGQRSQAPGPSA